MNFIRIKSAIAALFACLVAAAPLPASANEESLVRSFGWKDGWGVRVDGTFAIFHFNSGAAVEKQVYDSTVVDIGFHYSAYLLGRSAQTVYLGVKQRVWRNLYIKSGIGQTGSFVDAYGAAYREGVDCSSEPLKPDSSEESDGTISLQKIDCESEEFYSTGSITLPAGAGFRGFEREGLFLDFELISVDIPIIDTERFGESNARFFTFGLGWQF